MRDGKAVVETMKAFCRHWLCERNAAAAAEYLSESVYFVGTGEGETFHGRQAMAEYIRQDCQEEATPFHLTFENPAGELSGQDHAMAFSELLLENNQYSWRLRMSMALCWEEDTWRIAMFHVSEASDKQQTGEHYPNTLVLRNSKHQREKLLNEAVPGGMMGGYIEPQYPFYFVNPRMLEYLGYDDEADFVQDIGGYISNCMHPDDRAEVDRQVELQFEEDDYYTVEYRMRKKDGEYIWVRDLGRRIVAEDGRPAIISVCLDITDLHRTQEERSKLLDSIPGAVLRCRYEPGLEVLEANNGLFDIIGYSREEFFSMGNRLMALLEPEDKEALLPELTRQLEAGASNVYTECRVSRRDGKTIWMALRGYVREEEPGRRMLFALLTDATEQVTERQRIRARYQREMEYATGLVAPNLISKGVGNLEEDTLEFFLSDTDAGIENFYYTDAVDSVVNRLAQAAVAREDGEAVCSLFLRDNLIRRFSAGEAQTSIEFRRCMEGGQVIWCRTVARTYINPENNQLALFIYSFDVTQEKLSEQLLEQASTMEYDFLADVDMINDTYRGTANGADLRDMSGEGNFQAEIDRLLEMVAGPYRAEVQEKMDYDYIRNRLAREDRFTYTFPIQVQGQTRYKRCVVSYIDAIMGHICIGRTDITDIIQQEQRQREALLTALQAAEQASVAKSDFLSHMSHEIRTPLNAIIGMTTIAASAMDDQEEVANCLDKIGISSRFLLTLINDILDMSRIESGKMLLKNEPFSLEELIITVTNIIRPQAEQKNVSYTCVMRPGPVDGFIGDAIKLQQVLVNILSNAVKFTDAGGRVTFLVEQMNRAKSGTLLRFTITDTGIGISPKFLARMFDPFMQESVGTTAIYGGTGLGLSISKSIVDMMNGHIGVRSTLGKGSEFIVDVRLEPAAEECRRQMPDRLESRDILVVDSDLSTCQNTAKTLGDMGMSVEWVDSGEKAEARVAEACRRGRMFNMVILDQNLPGIDGLETARRLRRRMGRKPILMMSGSDCAAIEAKARQAGVDLLVNKPLFRTTLYTAINRALAERVDAGKPPAEQAGGFDFTGRRILVAEDHPLNTEIAVKLLKRVGFQVDTAENGERALALFSQAEPGYYDAILMDIRMPMMDGLTATTCIRQCGKADAGSIPIIAMTANAFEDDVEQSLAAGMNAHLAKPIDPVRLYQTLQDWIFQERRH